MAVLIGGSKSNTDFFFYIYKTGKKHLVPILFFFNFKIFRPIKYIDFTQEDIGRLPSMSLKYREDT